MTLYQEPKPGLHRAEDWAGGNTFLWQLTSVCIFQVVKLSASAFSSLSTLVSLVTSPESQSWDLMQHYAALHIDTFSSYLYGMIYAAGKISGWNGYHSTCSSPKAKTLQESLFKMQMDQRKGVDIYQSSTPWWELVSTEFSRLIRT